MYHNSYCVVAIIWPNSIIYTYIIGIFPGCKLSSESLQYTCDYEHIFLHGIINCLQKAILQCHEEFMSTTGPQP